MMEELKQKVNAVYGWSVEDGKPKPPKQDLPQAVKDRADYFWEMADGQDSRFGRKAPDGYLQGR